MGWRSPFGTLFLLLLSSCTSNRATTEAIRSPTPEISQWRFKTSGAGAPLLFYLRFAPHTKSLVAYFPGRGRNFPVIWKSGSMRWLEGTGDGGKNLVSFRILNDSEGTSSASNHVFSGSYERKSFSGTFTRGSHIDLMTGDPSFSEPAEPVFGPEKVLEEQIAFKSGDVQIAGTLSAPEGKTNCPAVVLVSGEGAEPRDGFPDRKCLKELAYYLGSFGIAVLRTDDRGIDGSGGNYELTTLGDLADDVIAGITLLRSKKNIDANRVGILGISEGGAIATIATARTTQARFVILLSTPGMSGAETILDRWSLLEDAMGNRKGSLAAERARTAKVIDVVLNGNPANDKEFIEDYFWKGFGQHAIETPAAATKMEARITAWRLPRKMSSLKFDASKEARKISVPALCINGAEDQTVPPVASIDRFRSAFILAGNGHATCLVWPEVGHSLMSHWSSPPQGLTYSPEILNFIHKWISHESSP